MIGKAAEQQSKKTDESLGIKSKERWRRRGEKAHGSCHCMFKTNNLSQKQTVSVENEKGGSELLATAQR